MNTQCSRNRMFVTVIVSAVPLLVATGVGLSAAREVQSEINIYWTDTGVYMGSRPEHLKRPEDFMFKTFQGAVVPVRPEIPSVGQILIPMPDNEHLPQTQDEWTEFTSRLKQGMLERIQSGLRQGVSDFEIRTVQNITIKSGYWVPWQQERCVSFGEAFQSALAEVKGQLSRHSQVNTVGIVGSNGGYLATESTARMGRTPLDRLIVVDARAYLDRTLQAAEVLKGNLTIINTGGDAPALGDMVANNNCARSAALTDPRIQVLFVDPKGWNWPASAHIATMLNQPDRELVVKSLVGDSYGPKQQMTLGHFKELVFQAQPSLTTKPGGVSMQMDVKHDSFGPAPSSLDLDHRAGQIRKKAANRSSTSAEK